MRHKSIVVLTGAGISAESGIQTFRGSGGLWENHRVEEVASPEGFASNPELVHRFYNGRRRQLLSASIEPNAAHYALAELEVGFPGRFLLVTQNVDDLHERSGSTNLIHMHGELLRKRCTHCGVVGEADSDLAVTDTCVHCGRRSGVRPHVVWFGETPFALNEIYAALQRCDLFDAIGTSAHVYPAAGFVDVAVAAAAHTVELNLEPSAVDTLFAEKVYGAASRIVPQFVRTLLD